MAADSQMLDDVGAGNEMAPGDHEIHGPRETCSRSVLRLLSRTRLGSADGGYENDEPLSDGPPLFPVRPRREGTTPDTPARTAETRRMKTRRYIAITWSQLAGRSEGSVKYRLDP